MLNGSSKVRDFVINPRTLNPKTHIPVSRILTGSPERESPAFSFSLDSLKDSLWAVSM